MQGEGQESEGSRESTPDPSTDRDVLLSDSLGSERVASELSMFISFEYFFMQEKLLKCLK